MKAPSDPLRSDARRNRDAVVDAATELLARKPEAAMREIADASGLGRTTVYRHFPTREDLILAIFERIVEEGRAVSVEAIAAGGGAEAVLRRIGVAFAGIGARYRFLEAHQDLGQQALKDSVMEDEPLLVWARTAHARGELASSLTPEWIYGMISPLAMGASEELASGRVGEDEAARMLGETLVRAFAAQPPR